MLIDYKIHHNFFFACVDVKLTKLLMVFFFLISLLFLLVLFFLLCMLLSQGLPLHKPLLGLGFLSYQRFFFTATEIHIQPQHRAASPTPEKVRCIGALLFLFVLIIHMQCIAIACSCFILQAHLWKASLTLLLSVSPGLRARLRLIPNPSERHFPIKRNFTYDQLW